MTKEDYLYIRLKCTIGYNSERDRRFYWRDPIGDHSTNDILMIEDIQHDGTWKIVYENQALVGSTFGVQKLPI